MAMKKTDLEKNKALKLTQAMKQSGSARFGKATADAAALDRRERRRIEQAQGLVPFACKLNVELVADLQKQAADHPEGMTGLLTELLTAGLAQRAQ
ncbi:MULTISPECIES: hypothetical protein [Burkholderia]|jgi:hypothetical protein|uniref:hypothetical protein n=1 Tax=Burkholderia TaxID=32008 RepID=UPI0018DB829A|nr:MULTISPECIES: hypothetical protein [Burkholderia]MBI0331057.1 hypothetical protein [Burkholderia plantarii]